MDNVVKVEQSRPMSFAYRGHEEVRVWQLYFMARRGWLSQLDEAAPDPDAFTDLLYGMAATIVEEMRREEREAKEYWQKTRAARLIRKQQSEAALANGIKPSTFASRLRNGWSKERALSTPTRAYRRRNPAEVRLAEHGIA
jgi:hypothetical protein